MTTDDNVKLAYDLIRSAATLLSAFPYAEAATSLRRQEEMAWFTNPTMMIAPGAVDDLKRKLRLLDAAAAFVAEWEAVKAEALASEDAA